MIDFFAEIFRRCIGCWLGLRLDFCDRRFGDAALTIGAGRRRIEAIGSRRFRRLKFRGLELDSFGDDCGVRIMLDKRGFFWSDGVLHQRRLIEDGLVLHERRLFMLKNRKRRFFDVRLRSGLRLQNFIDNRSYFSGR